MSYQNVGTPRFYVSLNEYLNSIGAMTVSSSENQDVSSLGFLNPSDQIIVETTGSNETDIDFIFDNPTSFLLNDKGYFLILGHNFATNNSRFSISDPEEVAGITETEIINSTQSISYFSTADYDGFSIFSCNYGQLNANSTGIRFRLTQSPKLGCVSFGNYYDMPHSPDLSLKLSFEYDGVKTIQTRGGATLSNATYTKPADWGDGGAWQLGSDVDGNPVDNLRSGRRVWDLSFSYISDSDLMPKVAATTNLGSGDNEYIDPDTNTAYENSLLQGTDFFSQVWNRTLGGHLPFIFQANSSNNSADQFSICRFDMNTLQYDQVANNVYNVKLKIREVW